MGCNYIQVMQDKDVDFSTQNLSLTKVNDKKTATESLFTYKIILIVVIIIIFNLIDIIFKHIFIVYFNYSRHFLFHLDY